MGQRGRTSAASREVAVTGDVEVLERPDAPYDLTDEQSEEWWAVVNRLPADWFPRETHALLGQYCRHVIAARRIASLVAACEALPVKPKEGEEESALDLDQYDKLLKMQEREGRALSSLATRLRITQQATRSAKTKKPTQVRRPWQS